ncbi:hypothetical protein, partial [Belnapia moabensis]|uniref:hypothetical protein n=1 Tax=Belnapia moabensis TaxID=365533 RepID=UPI00147077BF
MSGSPEPAAATGVDVPLQDSIVDEASLRALRAVQRMVPQGTGSLSTALAGGTVAAGGATVQPFGLGGGLRDGSALPGQPDVVADDVEPGLEPELASLAPNQLSPAPAIAGYTAASAAVGSVARPSSTAAEQASTGALTSIRGEPQSSDTITTPLEVVTTVETAAIDSHAISRPQVTTVAATPARSRAAREGAPLEASLRTSAATDSEGSRATATEARDGSSATTSIDIPVTVRA